MGGAEWSPRASWCGAGMPYPDMGRRRGQRVWGGRGVPQFVNPSLRSLWGSRWNCGMWAGQRQRGYCALDSGRGSPAREGRWGLAKGSLAPHLATCPREARGQGRRHTEPARQHTEWRAMGPGGPGEAGDPGRRAPVPRPGSAHCRLRPWGSHLGSVSLGSITATRLRRAPPHHTRPASCRGHLQECWGRLCLG